MMVHESFCNLLVIREKYLVYLSIVPGHRKLLPRPCPQCGQENGGVQFVFFNPHYYKERTGYSRHRPYHLMRISHYSKEEYRLKHKPTKIWHTFQFLTEFELNKGWEPDIKIISIDKLFDEPDYADKHSVTLQLTTNHFEYIKKYGWPPLSKNHAHWFNKVGPKRCQECGGVFESLRRSFIHFEEREKYLDFRDWNSRWVWLCTSCSTEKEITYTKIKNGVLKVKSSLPF